MLGSMPVSTTFFLLCSLDLLSTSTFLISTNTSSENILLIISSPIMSWCVLFLSFLHGIKMFKSRGHTSFCSVCRLTTESSACTVDRTPKYTSNPAESMA